MPGTSLGCCKNLSESAEWKIKMIVGLSRVDDSVFSVSYSNWCERGKKKCKDGVWLFFFGSKKIYDWVNNIKKCTKVDIKRQTSFLKYFIAFMFSWFVEMSSWWTTAVGIRRWRHFHCRASIPSSSKWVLISWRLVRCLTCNSWSIIIMYVICS